MWMQTSIMKLLPTATAGPMPLAIVVLLIALIAGANGFTQPGIISREKTTARTRMQSRCTNKAKIRDDALLARDDGRCFHCCSNDNKDTREFISSSDNDSRIAKVLNKELQRRSVLSIMLMASSSPAFISTSVFWAVSPIDADATETANDAIRAASPVPVPVEEPKECRNGAIVSESAVPGAYQQTCMNLEERSFILESSGDRITVYQGTNAQGGMAGRTGVAVWNSGVLLTRLLDKLNQSTISSSSSSSTSIFKDKTIFELGCGTGLASITVAKLGASSVYATDSNPEVLALAQRNIERNNLSSSNIARTVPLQWGLLDATEYDTRADVIIGSDLTYNSGSWVALAETMSTLLKDEGIVIYLTLGHSGFNVGGELGGFLSVAENTGLRVLQKDSKEYKNKIGSLRSVDELLASTITPDEKSVIDANGGVRVVILGKKVLSRKG